MLIIGDIVGRPGRRLIRKLLPGLVDRLSLDLVAANVENAAGGLGLTVKAAEELFSAGVQVMTSGNHIFRHKEIEDYLNDADRLIRPANYPSPAPGRGAAVVRTAAGVKVGLVNLLGRTYMSPLDCPFVAADQEVERVKKAGAQIVVVDFHAEATSEKRAMGWHLADRVGAVVGTHTHVQTADECILPGGAAYITDLGMTGPHDSVIGMRKEAVLDSFITGRPHRFTVAKRGLRLEGAVIDLEESTGRAKKIQRIQVDSD
jgi:hypothetical protein